MTMPVVSTAVRRPPRPALATVTRMTPTSRTEPGPVPVAAIQGTLALDLGERSDGPTPPELRLVADDHGDAEVSAWAGRFAQAVVEVLGGDRPLPQLVRWTTPYVYAQIGRRLRVLSRVSPATQRMRTVRAQVRSVHVCRPRSAVAEVSVHVGYGRRSRALAARLEQAEGRWTCTALELG